MKIAILDDFQDAIRTLDCFKKLHAHDVLVLNEHIDDVPVLAKKLEGVQALVLIRERSFIRDDLLSRLPSLRVIAQAGKAGRHLDTAACEARGIQVIETEGTSVANAEFTLLMVLASLRNFGQEIENMQLGLWQKTVGRQLQGRTLAILGLGRIGEQVARAGDTLGAKILTWGRESSRQRAQKNGWQFAASREDFFSQADVLCVLLRLTKETMHYVSAVDLALMKADAILVNTARAEIIEPNALYKALRLGRPGFAAVDVYEQEPVLSQRHPLQELKNCLCTPHLGFVERDNFENYMSQAFDALNTFADQA